jgi:four helix bundle protein
MAKTATPISPDRQLPWFSHGRFVALIRAMPAPSPERQRTLALHERVFRFACGVLNACPENTRHLASLEVWRQLVKAAPSTSNNLEEADEASSTRDFIAKMKIALREAKESRRCLRFVTSCRLAHHDRIVGLEDEARQIASIFAAIVINTKARYEEEERKKKAAKRAQKTKCARFD